LTLKGRKLYLYKSKPNHAIKRLKGLSKRFLLANKMKKIKKIRGSNIKGNKP